MRETEERPLRKNRLIQPIVLFCFILLLSSSAFGSTAVRKAADKIMDKINREVNLRGQVVQILPEQFSHKESGERTIFSRQLYDALVDSLIENGGVASRESSGEEWFMMTGHYVKGEKVVDITVKLMKFTGSSILGVASGFATIALNKLDEGAFGGGLEGLVDGMIHQIEREYLEIGSNNYIVERAEPSSASQPSLRLGRELDGIIETALSRSPVFGGLELVGHNTRNISWKTGYQVVGDLMHVDIRLVTEAGKTLNRTSGKISLKDIPDKFLERVKDSGVAVCVGYSVAGRKGEREDSPVVQELMAQVISLLNNAEINPSLCTERSGGVIVDASLSFQKRKTSYGYGLMTGRLKITLSRDGRLFWQKDVKEKLPLVGGGDTKNQLMEKMLTSSLVEEMIVKILTGD